MTQIYSSDVRLCVIGGSDVGKSAITVRFLTRRFIGEYQRNVELTYGGVIEFGLDTINYEFKDTATLPDTTFLATWPTCIAVVYSIIDFPSFGAASKVLNDIDTTLKQTLNSKNRTVPIALLGNKNDLEHFRRVRVEDGQDLALKYGATFWEVSASEDYYSVFRPLHSLIVESFLSNYSIWYCTPAGNEDKVSNKASVSHAISVSKDEESPTSTRRYSEPYIKSPQRKTSPTAIVSYPPRKKSDDVTRKQSEDVSYSPRRQSDDATSSSATPSPLLSALSRKRSFFRKTKSLSQDSRASITSAASPNSTPPTTPTPPSGELTHDNYSRSRNTSPNSSGNNVTIEVTTTNDDLLSPTRYCSHSQSFSKADKKLSLRRQSSLGKSQSFADLKDLKNLQDLQDLQDGGQPRIVVSLNRDVFLSTNVKGDQISRSGDRDNQLKRKKSVRRRLSSLFRPRSYNNIYVD